MAEQLWVNWRRSGPSFVKYLMYGFVGYRAYTTADRLAGALPGRGRRRLSLKEQCRTRGIRHMVTANVNGPDVVQALHDNDLDFIVIYWFDQIIREQVIDVPRRAVVNVHAAYLPNCRGLFPVLYSALEDGAPFGISAHTIENTKIDAGPVLAQRIVRPPTGHSVLYYDSVVNTAGVEMLTEVLADFDGHLERRLPAREGSYYSYPQRVHMAAARNQGLKLSSLGDFLKICKGLPKPGPSTRSTDRLPASHVAPTAR